LLAASVDALGSETVVDLGAGVGGVGLMIAARAEAVSLVFVEDEPTLADVCRRNIQLNGWEARGRVVRADILAPGHERRRQGLLPESADIVVTNPPFQVAGRSRPSPDASRAFAHQLPAGGLERWIRVCSDLLKPKGRLALIHRADRLSDCLGQLERGFGGVVVRTIHPRAGEPAIRIVLTAVKGSRAPLVVVPPLVLHGPDGRFTPEAEAIHRGETLLMQNGRP
jgi:tRNA1(Val) A37 N6-methylase TrmN6